MKIGKSIFFAIMVLVLAAPLAYANTLVAVCDPWPPFVDPQHPKDGLSMEIVRAAFKTQGYEVKYESMPWARAIAGVKEGTYDLLPNAWVTDERKEFLHFSDHYAINELNFIKRAGDGFEFSTLDSLDGKTIGTIRGYGYGDAFLTATNFDRDEVSDLVTNIRKLIANRIDLTLEDEIVARNLISQEDEGMLKDIEFCDNPLSQNTLHIAIGLAHPRHNELIQAFNNGLQEIKSSGVYEEILKSYGVH